VAQLSGYVAEHSAYHHGEVSLAMTIVNMAQDYVGSNNLNLLQPIGQFGTRQQGGKDFASSRYIFTNLHKATRLVYPEADMAVMDYQTDEGMSIEPTFYTPILPMVLVNGSEGIGTGWSSFVPQFNPLDLITQLRRKLNGQDVQSIKPWFRGYSGTITEIGPNQFQTTGKFTVTKNDRVEITELPIGVWTGHYKHMLE
jgi:DNA topoisomerase II